MSGPEISFWLALGLVGALLAVLSMGKVTIQSKEKVCHVVRGAITVTQRMTRRHRLILISSPTPAPWLPLAGRSASCSPRRAMSTIPVTIRLARFAIVTAASCAPSGWKNALKSGSTHE
jgi:hypothetical protein